MSGCITIIIIAIAVLTASSAFLQIANSQGSFSSDTLSVNTTSSDSSAPAMKYNAAREQFLDVWDTLGFHPLVATYVNESAELGNGLYQERSNIFSPGEDILLYVQPIGFGHQEIEGQGGEKLYLMNFTADIVASFANGTVLGGAQNIPISDLVSHYRNTEIFLSLLLSQESPLPQGDYVINYRVVDQTSGRDFRLSRDIVIS
jgi:hypothetical protein